MWVQVALGIVALVALVGVVAQIYRHMGRVSRIPEGEVNRTMRHQPFWRHIVRFIASKQKIITAALLTKIIRRLKVISLKTDNLSSKLLQKLEKERRELRREE